VPARFDHLVIAVDNLDAAIARWTAAGLPAVRGGRHPVGTENALVRGPEPAYVELIVAADEGSAPARDRVRSVSGPIAWALAVDDVEASRGVLVAAGFDPGPVTAGSRRTPDGQVVRWRLCDVGAGPYAADLPFLIEWTEPMPPGPASGPVVGSLVLAPPDPEPVADVLLALGLRADEVWPRRVFGSADDADRVRITLLPLGDPQTRGEAVVVLTGEGSDPVAGTTLHLEVAAGEPAREELLLDGVAVWLLPDRRRFRGAALVPAVEAAYADRRGDLADWPDPHPMGAQPAEEEYSRCLDPGRYRLLGVRAEAWIAAIEAAGLGVAEPADPAELRWTGEVFARPERAVRVTGAPGTAPLVVAWAAIDGVAGTVVLVGSGEPTVLLERQPDCGCDACDTGSRDLVETLDAAFLLALEGGVLAVREGDRSATRSLFGWSGTNVESVDVERWFREAEEGLRRDGVTAGEPWL
jgi:hypothetical protein